MKKHTLKVLICLILSAVVALSLFACGNQTDNGQANTDTDEKIDGPVNGTADSTPDSTPAGTGKTEDTDPADTGKVDENIPTREEFFAKDQLVIYPELPEQIHRNYDYKVTVTQGLETKSIPVYNHTMEYEVFNRSVGGDLYRRFSQFAFSGKQVRVDIKVNRDFEYYSVIPSAKNFKTEFNGGIISVYLDKPDYFGIRLDNDDNSILSVFADLPEYPGDIPAKNDPNTIWIEGWHDVEGGILKVEKKNSHLYIAPGAVLNGRVDMRGAYSKITGRGVILDAFANSYKLDIRDGGTESHGVMLCQLYAEGIEFDGPILMDARCFNLMSGSKNAKVRNYKALSTMMTTDGITAGGENKIFEHCWIYCGDNALVLGGSKGHTYRDITIGTTCAAIFPQNDNEGTTLENIYIFRSNDGIINNRYNGGAKERKVDVTFKNIDCMDCLNVNRFLQAGNMGTLKKTMVFDGISLPKMTGVTNPHKSSFNEYKNLMVEFTNANDIFTENYDITFNNVYIDGKAITDANQIIIEGDYKNTVTFTNDGKYTPVKHTTHTVNYKGIRRVYIGSYLMGFENDVLEEDGTFLLPTQEILKALRSTKQPETVDRKIPYCSPDALLKAGAIEKFEIKNGDLYLTPVYNGRNLFMAEEGVLPQVCEADAYKVDMVTEDNDGDYIYYLYDLRNYYAGGLSVMFTEEVKKYGAGTYEFKFRARGAKSGGITLSWKYDNFDNYFKQESNETLSSTWKEYSITLKIDQNMVDNCEMFAVTVMASGTPMEYFAVKELELIKK